MYNLFFDTSTNYLVIGLFNNNKMIQNKILKNTKKHSENAVEYLFDFLRSNNINLNEIKSIYFTIGPGSFMGLRTSLTTIKTIKFCYPNIHLMSINTLYFLSKKGKSIPKIEFGKNKSYFTVFNNQNILIEEQIVDNETFNEIITNFKDYKIVNSFFNIDLETHFFDHIKNFKLIESISDIKINYI